MESTGINTPDGLIRPDVQLMGGDGNAFAVMGAVTRALKQAGNPPAVIESYCEQAMAGDYDHLLAVSMEFVEVC